MLETNVAIVTGGSRGIGRAIVEKLATDGYAVAFNYNSNQVAAAEVVASVADAGGTAKAFQADIADREARREFIEFVDEHFGRCELLVNNAGVAPLERRDILDTTEESYDRVMDINLKGPYFLTQAVARWMIRQKAEHPGRAYRICNIGSLSAYASSTNRGEYCLSKAGLSMLTKLFADRLGEYGINVFEVRPGITKTDMTSAVSEKYDRLIAEGLTPLKRWGLPEDVAEAVAAVAAGSLDFSTGEVLNVDGGFHMRRL